MEALEVLKQSELEHILPQNIFQMLGCTFAIYEQHFV